MTNRDEYLGEQLVVGLKQVEINVQALRKLQAAKGLDLNGPYTKNTENLLKIAYVDEALKGLNHEK